MFTKDKKRAGEKKSVPQNRAGEPAKRRPAEGERRPAGEMPRRRPAERAPEPSKEAMKRRPAGEAPRRRPAERAPEPSKEAMKRRPVGEAPRRRPAGRAAEPSKEAMKRRPAGEAPIRAARETGRRRPAEEAPRRRQEGEVRRRPEEEKRPLRDETPKKKPAAVTEEPTIRMTEADSNTVAGLARKLEQEKRAAAEKAAAEQKEAGPSQEGENGQEPQPEDQVFKIPQAPRETPAVGRKPEGEPQRTPRREMPKKKIKSGPPQGTSYHRSAPRPKKSLMDLLREKTANPYADPEEQAAAARARKEARAQQKKKLQKLAAKLDAPAIVYTQPKPFNRNRLLIQMVSVLAVASAFVLALSIFFKVETITVSGAETYSPYKIEEASGIKKGDYLFTFGRARASGQITAKLPYIKSVRIGIKLPNTVNIDVQEADVVYSIRSDDGDWWLITSEGKVVEQIPGTTSGG